MTDEPTTAADQVEANTVEKAIHIHTKTVLLEFGVNVQRLGPDMTEIQIIASGGTVYALLVNDKQKADLAQRLTGGIELPGIQGVPMPNGIPGL